MNSRVVLISVFTLLLLTGVVRHILPVQSQLSGGDILVIDEDAGTGGGALFRVNPTTGARTILSDFGSGTPTGVNPYGVAVYPVLSKAVGGVVTPVNKLQILAPYLVLAGLVGAVTVAFAIRKRHRD